MGTPALTDTQDRIDERQNPVAPYSSKWKAAVRQGHPTGVAQDRIDNGWRLESNLGGKWSVVG